MFKLVIVDFDDTLCLTEEATFRMENELVVEMGHEPMTREAHQKTWGMPLKEAIVLRVPGIDADQFMDLLALRIKKHAREGKLDVISEENMTALDALIAHGKKLAILTSRSMHEVEHLLEKDHPIQAKFEKIYHKGNSEFIKPDPRAFDKILKDFSTPPDGAVYFGDAVTDAEAAKGAGLHFVAVMESGLRTENDFKGKNVDFFAPTFVKAVEYVLTK